MNKRVVKFRMYNRPVNPDNSAEYKAIKLTAQRLQQPIIIVDGDRMEERYWVLVDIETPELHSVPGYRKGDYFHMATTMDGRVTEVLIWGEAATEEQLWEKWEGREQPARMHK